MKLKKISLTATMLSLLLSSFAFADVEHEIVRKFTGLSNPASLGDLVTKDGTILNTKSVISVLSPRELQKDCIYAISFIRKNSKSREIKLVPPLYEMSCNHNFPNDK